jgi:hypothetical protein
LLMCGLCVCLHVLFFFAVFRVFFFCKPAVIVGMRLFLLLSHLHTTPNYANTHTHIYIYIYTASCGPTALFFGCRYQQKDYLYGAEWQEYVSEGFLPEWFSPAFSREQSSKVYVQHRILDQASLLYVWMTQKNARIFLAGYVCWCTLAFSFTLKLSSSPFSVVCPLRCWPRLCCHSLISSSFPWLLPLLLFLLLLLLLFFFFFFFFFLW